MGGTDTQCIDNKHMTAYDLALNYKNEFAIRELMTYESNNKKRGDFLNEEMLMKSVESELYAEGSCYANMFNCFVDCFLCFKPNLNDDD